MENPTPTPSNQVFKDLFAGTAGGITQVLVGQPFDIVKVRLQSSDAYKGMGDAVGKILKEEGAFAFYKGTALPLVGIGACVSIQFGCLEYCKRYFNPLQTPSLTLTQLYLSGAFAGVGNSVLSGPVEHIRIRLQTQTSANGGAGYSGPGDALKKIWRSDGLRGIYCGQGATVLREFHGFGMYFLGYEWLVERHVNTYGLKDRKGMGMGWAVVYGAGAGYSMWLSSYPLDVIKSRLQTSPLPSASPTGKSQTVIQATKQLWRMQGWKGFVRGLGPTLIRSPVVNGATFAAFEATMRVIG